MIKKILVLFILLISISLINGSCEQGQIDINTATLTELDKLSGVGPVKAQSIIDSRPFESVNELIKVHGIGEKTLEKILNQKLACVKNKEEQGNKEKIIKEIISKKQIKEDNSLVNEKSEENIQPTIINLNPKVIKTEDDKKELNKNDYAKYGFVGFCVLLGFLFIFKKNKNEFR